MRYAIFSDVHANRQAWEAVRADALRQRADTLVCLGDIVGYGPRPLEVLTSVREATPNFVLGNHDAAACGRLDASIFNPHAQAVIEWTRERLDAGALEFLNQMPLQMEGDGIEFVHAEVSKPGEFGYVDGPGPAGVSLQAMTQSLAFIGHTHLPMAYTVSEKGGQVNQLAPIDFQVERGKRTLVNVGSVGEPRTTDVRASYVIYDDVEQTVTFRQVAFDVDAYKADLAEVGLDIHPYFVQVVDAGRVAGAQAPAPAPQLAMAQLPKVAEVVGGHQGRIVLGTLSAGAAAATPLKKPRSVPKGLIFTFIVLVAACVAGVAIYINRSNKENVAANKREGTRTSPAASRGPRVDSDGALKNLKAKLFEGDISSLPRLRELEKIPPPTLEFNVPNGVLSLSAAQGMQSYGLIWHGELHAPQSGVYEFTLDCDDGAALFLDDAKLLEVGGQGRQGAAQTTKVALGTATVRFKLEYLQAGGDSNLELTWKQPDPGTKSEPPPPAPETTTPAVASDPVAKAPEKKPPPPDPPAPRPDPDTEPAEKLSVDLLSYWSFDGGNKKGNRIKKQPDGSVHETLVAEKNQRVQVLVPKRDIGTGWRNPDFEATNWTLGQNGVGYEEKPADYKDLIRTKAGGAPKKQPQSIYVRIPFKIDDPAAYAGLALYMKFDDGFVAFLNGQPMANKNAPVPLQWNSAASGQNDDKKAVAPELFKASQSLRHLRRGWNVLAIHGLNGSGKPNASNTGSASSDMLILPSLIALRKDKALPEPAGQEKRSPWDMLVAKNQVKGSVDLTGGRSGDAYRFNGGSIELGEKDKYSIGDHSFSVSLWLRTSKNRAEKESRYLISAGANGAKHGGWALLLNRASNTLAFHLSDGEKLTSVSETAKNLTNDTWWHVAATVDRPSGMVQLYLNGLLLADKRVDFVGKNTIKSKSGLSIGRNSADKQHFMGNLDDIAIWHRALVPEEVDRIFQHGNGLGSILDR